MVYTGSNADIGVPVAYLLTSWILKSAYRITKY